jgi:hypothetical protein
MLPREVVSYAGSVLAPIFTRSDPDAQSAWRAWRDGDLHEAQARSEQLLGRQTSSEQARDEASHILALTAHVQGRHTEALVAYRSIGKRYRARSKLDEPILWSYVRLGEVRAAHAFASERGLLKSVGVKEQLRLALEHPMCVESPDVVELPFTDDSFSTLMPGIHVRLNGQPQVARLDTGGSFIHLTRSQADALGVRYAGCGRDFAGLRTAELCHGVADLELGSARFRNCPVLVHSDEAMPVRTVADAFNAEMNLVIGTCLLERFLSTIDSPGRRLVLSRRGNLSARSDHMARLDGRAYEVPFALLGSHLMIARGTIGTDRRVSFFIDSGLAVFRQDQGQAALLLRDLTVREWGIESPKADEFAEIRAPVALGAAAQLGLKAYVVPERTWRAFGDWSGMNVAALLSHAFFRHYRWTIDFDRHVFTLQKPAASCP